MDILSSKETSYYMILAGSLVCKLLDMKAEDPSLSPQYPVWKCQTQYYAFGG